MTAIQHHQDLVFLVLTHCPCLFVCFVLFVCLFVCENAPAVSLSPKELVVIPLADPESLQSEWATIWWNS